MGTAGDYCNGTQRASRLLVHVCVSLLSRLDFLANLTRVAEGEYLDGSGSFSLSEKSECCSLFMQGELGAAC